MPSARVARLGSAVFMLPSPVMASVIAGRKAVKHTTRSYLCVRVLCRFTPVFDMTSKISGLSLVIASFPLTGI